MTTEDDITDILMKAKSADTRDIMSHLHSMYLLTDNILKQEAEKQQKKKKRKRNKDNYVWAWIFIENEYEDRRGYILVHSEFFKFITDVDVTMSTGEYNNTALSKLIRGSPITDQQHIIKLEEKVNGNKIEGCPFEAYENLSNELSGHLEGPAYDEWRKKNNLGFISFKDAIAKYELIW